MANASAGDGVPLKRTGWSTQIKLTDALDGKPPPGPRIAQWADVDGEGKSVTRALFYPNEVHSVFGEPESMKSWLLLMASVQEVKLGKHVFYVDMEANDRSIVERLRLLGATRAEIKGFFHYFRPDDQINDADQRRFKSSVVKCQPTLVVLDGVTEAFALHGLSINSSEDSAHWFSNFARQFTVDSPSEDYAGPAIVELDHVVKDREGRGSWALGSQHKKAGIKGSAYQVVPVRPFGRGKHGISRLLLEKDSPGGVEWIPYGRNRQRLAGLLHCDATTGGVDAYIESPDLTMTDDHAESVPLAETVVFRNTMHEVWKFVVDNPACSLRAVRAGVTASNENVATALELLERQGYIRNEAVGTKQKWVGEEGVAFDPIRVTPTVRKGG